MSFPDLAKCAADKLPELPRQMILFMTHDGVRRYLWRWKDAVVGPNHGPAINKREHSASMPAMCIPEEGITNHKYIDWWEESIIHYAGDRAVCTVAEGEGGTYKVDYHDNLSLVYMPDGSVDVKGKGIRGNYSPIHGLKLTIGATNVIVLPNGTVVCY